MEMIRAMFTSSCQHKYDLSQNMSPNGKEENAQLNCLDQ
jgi:hypothetical protein